VARDSRIWLCRAGWNQASCRVSEAIVLTTTGFPVRPPSCPKTRWNFRVPHDDPGTIHVCTHVRRFDRKVDLRINRERDRNHLRRTHSVIGGADIFCGARDRKYSLEAPPAGISNFTQQSLSAEYRGGKDRRERNGGVSFARAERIDRVPCMKPMWTRMVDARYAVRSWLADTGRTHHAHTTQTTASLLAVGVVFI